MTVKKVRGGGAREADEVPKPRAGFAKVVETVFAVEIRVEEYQRLERELSLSDASNPVVIRSALNRAQQNASEAHRLYIVAKVEYEIFEAECQKYLAPMREQAIRELKAEPNSSKKGITETDVETRMLSLFHDQVIREKERREKSAKTVSHLYRLAELWKERAFTLNAMK